jgi:hypothetical protein
MHATALQISLTSLKNPRITHHNFSHKSLSSFTRSRCSMRKGLLYEVMHMRGVTVLLLLLLSCSLWTGSAIADEPDSCAVECEAGQVRISFLDGQQVSCTCMDQGPGMIDDSAAQSGGQGDQENGHES